MKKLNLIERLLSYSHEKQTPQRFRRYAGMLLMLLTLGVGQMWAATKRLYYDNSSTNWSTVCCYCWGGSEEKSWPGNAMTRIGSTSIWYYDVDADTYGNCIFNNNNNGKQTPDQSIPSNKNKCTYDGSSASWGTHQETSTASLAASKTSMTTAQTSTLTPSLSTNADHNVIKSTSYEVTTNPESAGSVTSAGVFSATAAGTYTVTATVTYNAKGFSNITKTATATRSITVTVPTYSVTYHANGGSGTKPTDGSSPYTSGSTVTALGKNTLYKTNYVFAGWNTASDGSGTYYAPGATFSITANTNLYAIWLDKAVLDGTNVMFYYQGYCDGNCNNRLVKAQNDILTGSTNLSAGYGYAHTAKSNLSSYYYISNNPTGWGGKANNDIKTASGGELFKANNDVSTTSAKTASTSATPDGTDLSISTTCSSATGVYNSKSLYILYYLEDEIIAVTYSGTPTMFIPASTYARASSISGLADGDYTIKTILTDGLVYYIADTDEFTISSATRTLTYHANYAASGTGSVPAAQTVALNASATVAGNTGSLAMDKYTFAGWNTSQYIDGTPYAAGSSITMDENKDLYAKWTYNVTLNANGGAGGSANFVGVWNCSTLPSITNPSRTGYNFVEWNTQADGEGSDVIVSGVLQASKYNWTDGSGRFQRNPSSTNKPLYAKWTAKTYTEANNLDKNGGDSHGKYTATYDKTTITINTTPVKSGYHVDGYYKEEGLTNLIATSIGALQASTAYTDASSKWTNDGNVTLFTKWAPNNYTIELNDNGGSGGDGTHAVTFDAATGSLTNAPERDGYTFAGYWTGSGGTGTQIFNADLTPIQNVSGYTDNTSDKKWIYADNKTLYAKWTEIKYTVTLVNATASSVSAGCATHPSITASTAPFGMKFDHWDVSGGASVASTTSNPTTVSATAAGTVTAVYTQGLYAFIEGRFHVADASTHSSWTNTFDDGDWNQNSTKIQFAYDESSHIFYLHTYATANALTTQISSQNPVFFIKTSTSPSSLTGVTEYKMSSATQITDKGSSNGATFNSHATGNTDNGNLRINSSDVSALVTLYFDGTKVWYDYSPAIINTVSLSGTRVPPGASITATPSMYYKGNTNKAYCWSVYTDAACTSQVTSVSFNSLGAGKVQFTVPQAQNTYYLKLTVRASDACEAAIEDEDVQSFRVTTNPLVFFNNTATKWSNVYVYFLGKNSYWDNTYGAGCKNRDGGQANQMHRIGKSDIYYFDYTGHTTDFNLEDTVYVAFTEIGKPDADKFYYVKAAYRGDFSECAPMYVPTNAITISKNSCDYNNTGYWTNYDVSGVARDAGFTLKVFDGYDGGTELASVDLSNTDGSNTYRATVNLTRTNHKHGFQLLSCGHLYYGNNGTMTAGNSTGWDQEVDKHRCGLESMAAGAYTFIVQCTDEGNLKVSVEYPLMNGDYRLMYNDTCVYQAHAHPSQFIRRKATKLDTVSMYIRPDKQPVLKIQVCDNASSNPPVWRDSVTYDVSGLTNGHRVYNFYISQADGKLTINNVRPYAGSYYVRTQQLDGGWYNYETNSDNVMTYTEYAEQMNYGFNYYKAKWVGTTGADVTFTIANDYSESLCDTMVADPGNNPLTAAEACSLPHTASVRFGWNSQTNTLHRAYINGTSIVSDRYLVMIGDEKMKDKDGNALEEGEGQVAGLNEYEMNFTDLNNWIYRADITAVEGAAVKLTANYDSHTQYFIGALDKAEEILGGNSGKEYGMRVTYDFKTNRLMTAWLPNGDIDVDMTLKADMLLIREGQNAATQVHFSGTHSINEVHSIYGVMEFQYDKIVGKFPTWGSTNAYKYLMYYISFPFDVKVSEIFGCGVRGENWIVQKYNGAKRARIGWFAETSTFWETMEGSETMKAHEGYLLILDRISFNSNTSKIWENMKSGGSVYLYFPSASKTIGTINNASDTTIVIPEHTCEIDRSFTLDGVAGTLYHRNTDSHWNVIGTPLFETNTANIDEESSLKYFYRWDCSDNSLSVEGLCDTTTFKSMHGYMVQYAGDVIFSGSHIVPALAARRVSGDNKNYRIELRMENADNKSSRTYVELRENACDTFALNEDMYMVRSSTMVDLYTFAGAYDVAANVLSMNNHIVPVGMDVKCAGTYRFTMPSDFSGTVTLIDTEADVRTNLALGDYEVKLPKGTSNNRFFLEINIHQMPTAIDGVGGSLKDGKAHKFIENGQMYILQNGIIYDARGNRVR